MQIRDHKDPIWKAIRHPFPIATALIFIADAFYFTLRHRNPFPVLFFALIEFFWAAVIIATLQTGEIQTTQGRGTKRYLKPFAYWCNVSVLLTFTLTFAILFLFLY